MSKQKAIAIALGVLVLVLAVLPFRTPIRKFWRHRNARHEQSKGMLKNPEAMAFGKDGTIYVGNQDSGDIVILNPDGSFRSRFDKVDGYVSGDGSPTTISRGLYMHCPAPGRLLFTAY